MPFLLSPRGRLGRLPFLVRALAFTAAFYPVNLVGGLAWAGRKPADGKDVLPAWLQGNALPEPFADIALGAAALLLVGLFLAVLAASARRCHDIGFSAWCLAIPFVVGVFLPHIELPPPLYSLWPWVWILALAAWPGSPDLNRFGVPCRRDSGDGMQERVVDR